MCFLVAIDVLIRICLTCCNTCVHVLQDVTCVEFFSGRGRIFAVFCVDHSEPSLNCKSLPFHSQVASHSLTSFAGHSVTLNFTLNQVILKTVMKLKSCSNKFQIPFKARVYI